MMAGFVSLYGAEYGAGVSRNFCRIFAISRVSSIRTYDPFKSSSPRENDSILNLVTSIILIIKKMLTRRKESDTYLATVSRHCWSQQIAM